MARGTLVDEDVAAEPIAQDTLDGVERAPAGDHVFAVAVVLDVRDDSFGKIG